MMALTIAISDQSTEIPLSEFLASSTVSSPCSSASSGSRTSHNYSRIETQNVRAAASNRKRDNNKFSLRKIRSGQKITIPVDVDWNGLNESLDISSDTSDSQDEDGSITQHVVSTRHRRDVSSVNLVDKSHYLLNVNKLQRFENVDTLSSEEYQYLTSTKRLLSEITRSKIPVPIKKPPYSVLKTRPIREQPVPKLECFAKELEALLVALTIAIRDQNTGIPLSECLASSTVLSPYFSASSGNRLPHNYVSRIETQNVRAAASNRKRDNNKVNLRKIRSSRKITIPVDVDWNRLKESLDISSDTPDSQDDETSFTQHVVSTRHGRDVSSVNLVDKNNYLLNINKVQRYESVDTLSSEEYQYLMSKKRLFCEIPRSNIPVPIKKPPYSVLKTQPIHKQSVPKLEYFTKDFEVSNTFFY